MKSEISINAPDQAVFRRAALRWFRTKPRSFPWRAEDDPYRLLVGEILLQRTRGEHVIDVYAEFVRRWPDPRSLARARINSLQSVIRPLGLLHRALTLKRLGKALDELGEVPILPEDLLRLPGVGPYAAHSIPVFAQGKDYPMVDWVIARILRRYFGLDAGKRPAADKILWAVAASLASKGKARQLWLGTLDFAAAICKPRPLCHLCPLQSSCAYFGNVSDQRSAEGAVNPAPKLRERPKGQQGRKDGAG